MISGESFKDEERIVWTADVSALPYVREHVVYARRRRGAPFKQRYGSGRIVGYAELHAKAPSHPRFGGFPRRVFWLSKHDPWPNATTTGGPSESVKVASIVAGRPGESAIFP